MSDFKANWLYKYLGRKHYTVLDVGSYDGGDSVKIKKRYKDATVHAFEADRMNFEKVKKAGARFNFFVHNVAVSDFSGTTTFNPSRGKFDGSGSILEPNMEELQRSFPGMEFDKPDKVKTITIEQFCNDQQLKVDLVHMDVQGAEWKVINGFGSVQPILVFLEKTEYNKYKGAYNENELNKLMERKGYLLLKRLRFDNLYILEDYYHANRSIQREKTVDFFNYIEDLYLPYLRRARKRISRMIHG